MTIEITAELVDGLRRLAQKAGERIMEIYETDFAVEDKGDGSPVTLADRAAEEIIVPVLRQLLPGVAVVAEEMASAGEVPEVGDGPFWLVDPLDGTKQFVGKRGEFTVNIALVEGGRPVLGVIHAPAMGQTYVGSPLGAFQEGRDGTMQPIAARPRPDDGIVAVVSRSHRTAGVDAFLQRFAIKEEITSGSSIKLCLVAKGRADLYPRFGRTMEWDTAAGHAILSAGGGRVVTEDGRPLAYGKPGFENPNFIALGAWDGDMS